MGTRLGPHPPPAPVASLNYRMPQTTIVLVIDRLSSGFLGPYGNTWVETPAFNYLASRGELYERCLSDALDLRDAYRALFRGKHPLSLEPSADTNSPSDLWSEFYGGRKSCFVTDEPELVGQEFVELFELLHIRDEPTERANRLQDTQFAKLLGAANKWMQSNASEPSLVWIHASALNRWWDGPLEARFSFAEEDDPLPPEFLEAPNLALSSDPDPDEKLGFAHAYAGEVLLIDTALQGFLDDLERVSDDVTFAIGSTRAYPLGEHQQVGGDNLYAETTHVPWIISRSASNESRRSQDLLQPHQWLSTLVSDRVPTSIGDRALSVHDNNMTFHTPVWSLVTVGEARHLYAKPDDRWDFNDVSDVCPNMEELIEARENYVAWLGNKAELSSLPETLVERWE